MDLTAEDQKRSEEPMYVVVEFRPLEPEKFRRQVLFVQPSSGADAEELADHQREIAKLGGRRNDTYEVYELCKPGSLEAARRAGREDAAKAIEAELVIAVNGFYRAALRKAINLARGIQQPRTPDADVTP